MFKTLLTKEIQTAIIDFRFWVVLVLCMSIIPLSFYVSVKNYTQRVSDYQQAIQTYRTQSDGNVDAFFAAEGIRPPSPLSIFSRGLDDKMPYKVVTSRDGRYQIEYAKPDNKGDLLGKIDFAFIVVFVLSILAITFTFSAISGDKESGMLRAVLANPVLRRQVLIAKLIGNYIVFLIPFLLSVFVALLIIYFSGTVAIFSAELFPSVLLIIGVSMLLLFALFNLGLWMSALARNSILSINILLLIWIVVGLVIPKVSPIISEAIYPIESTNVFESKKALLIQNITKEQYGEEIELYERICDKIKPESKGITTSGHNDVNDAYDKEVVPIREKYEQLLVSEINKITADYDMRQRKQNRISKVFSSLSFINSANNLMAELSSTGYSEADNFLKQAQQYQEMVKQNIYDKFIYNIYRTRGGWASGTDKIGDFDEDKLPIPVLDTYKHASIAQVIQQNWTDIVLLAAYCLLFFVGAFISFQRFDVR